MKLSLLCNSLMEVSYFLRSKKGPFVIPQCQSNAPMLVQIFQKFWHCFCARGSEGTTSHLDATCAQLSTSALR